MDPELKKALDEIHALAKDNHDMLRAIRRDQWLGFFGRIVIWIIVLALPLYLYQQYFQPLVAKFYPASNTATSSSTGMFGLPSSAQVQKLINSYTTGK